ncbi:bifunctional aminoglycoside phosphotransferase/ATP-binding protein [Nocardia asteroides]|uniref:bifunctional aminoglycoside phosphotransferase/ATP-binding protein n=1 Tax=Nocardia asteroides TaxID=1824 RepID=UPI003659A242
MNPAALPAQVHETHTAVVVLCGGRAYKSKKPVRTDFLDFSSAALREEACARELALNVRLAPDVYLGVAHLDDPQGGPAEPILVMRRMPEQRRLSVLITANAVPAPDLTALVELLARFHDTAQRSAEIDRAGGRDAVRERWRSLLGPLRDATELVDPMVLARIEHRATRYLDGRAALFADRIAQGRVVDGHGDLLAEDIFELPDGFRVLDCLDFDDDLRHVDRVDDIAFLAMDFEFLGHPDLARRLLADYFRVTDDPVPASLVDHYIAYRAMVRAKVDLIRAGQGDTGAGARLRGHLDIAAHHLAAGTVRLTLIGGLPGTGKSTLAAHLADRTGSVVLGTDHLRKELARCGEIDGDTGRFGAGRYSATAKAAVYDALFDRARELLAQGVSVILDASWIRDADRRGARALAEQVCVEMVTLRCVCPRDLAHRRIRARRGGDSDATADIADAMAASDTDWLDAVVVDTSLTLGDSLDVAFAAWADPVDVSAVSSA